MVLPRMVAGFVLREGGRRSSRAVYSIKIGVDLWATVNGKRHTTFYLPPWPLQWRSDQELLVLYK